MFGTGKKYIIDYYEYTIEHFKCQQNIFSLDDDQMSCSGFLRHFEYNNSVRRKNKN